jgi:hypothetical protein
VTVTRDVAVQCCAERAVAAAAAAQSRSRSSPNNVFKKNSTLAGTQSQIMVLKNRDVLKAERKAKKGLKAVAHPAIRCPHPHPFPSALCSLLPTLATSSPFPVPLHSKLWDSKKSPSSNHNALGPLPTTSSATLALMCPCDRWRQVSCPTV